MQHDTNHAYQLTHYPLAIASVIIGELYEEARRRAVTDGHSVTVPTSKQRRNHSRGGDGVPTIAEGDEAQSEDSDAESVAPAVTTVHTSKDLGLLGEGKDDDPEYSKVMGLLRVPLVTPAATMIFLREHKVRSHPPATSRNPSTDSTPLGLVATPSDHRPRRPTPSPNSACARAGALVPVALSPHHCLHLRRAAPHWAGCSQ